MHYTDTAWVRTAWLLLVHIQSGHSLYTREYCLGTPGTLELYAWALLVHSLLTIIFSSSFSTTCTLLAVVHYCIKIQNVMVISNTK